MRKIMKKLIIVTAISALLSSTAVYASLDNIDQAYVKINGMIGMGAKDDNHPGALSDEYGETTFNGGVAFGYNAMDTVRAEVSLLYVTGPEYKKGTEYLKNDGFVGLVNGFVDLAEMGAAKIYVGAGIGVASIESEWQDGVTAGTPEVITPAVKYDTTEWGMAYTVGAGVSFEAGPGAMVDVGYSYNN